MRKKKQKGKVTYRNNYTGDGRKKWDKIDQKNSIYRNNDRSNPKQLFMYQMGSKPKYEFSLYNLNYII